jgi:PAS domain S-box-containing protein
VFGSRSSLAGWCLVAVLSFPSALVVGLWAHHSAGLPSPGRAVVLTSLLLMLLRMGTWFVFQSNWRKAERLRQAQANRRLTAIAASCQEMLWETRDNRFVYLAPTVTAYLGYGPEELLGKPALTIYADFERDRAANMVRTSSLSGCGWKNEEFTFVAKNGELRDFVASGLAQTDGDGKVVGFAGALRGLEGLPERQQTHRLQHQIQQLIDEPSLTTVFQPIIDIRSGMAVGAEALTRFPPTEPMLGPDKWFIAAARAGLGVELELTAIQQALAVGTATLPNDLYLSVNISPATLLTGLLNEVIHQSGWNPARIVVEITEHVSVEDYQALTARIEALRRQGLRLAVDDAGAGYASFRHILALKPDFIKLDRALIAGIDTDPGKRALVKAVTSFAGDIGATVTAEGIETAQELQAAALLGVQGGQGFYIAKPNPVSAWPEIHRNPPTITIPTHPPYPFRADLDGSQASS